MGDELKVTQADKEAAKDAWEKAALADLYCDPRNTGPDFGPEPRDPEGILAEAFARHRIATETQSQATIDELVGALNDAADDFSAIKEAVDADDGRLCWRTAYFALSHIDIILSRHEGGQS